MQKFPPKQFIAPNTGWKTFPSQRIPSTFCYGTIKSYIESIKFACDSDNDDDYDINNNEYVPTLNNTKAMRRGRILFTSGHVQELEDNLENGLYYLRSNVNASFKDIIYNVVIVLTNDSKVIDASCQCKASESKSCSHIIALMFTLEDFTILYGFQPTSCTSKLKTWNMGRKRGREPKSVFYAAYPHHSKVETDRKRYLNFEPVPTIFSKTTELREDEDLLKNLQACSRYSMFEAILKIKYKDYCLEPDMLNILKLKTSEMISELVSVNSGPVHLIADQNTSSWLGARRVRITASNAKSFFTAKSLDNLINRNLWLTSNLSNIPAIKYGRDSEPIAFDEYKRLTGYDLRKCGFFTNKSFPGLGCSPDGLVYDKYGKITAIIEIKCPIKICNTAPWDLDNIKNRETMCYTVTDNAIKLKRDHQYYFQIQLCLAIMELKSCDFIVWSKLGLSRETVERNESFISSLTKKLLTIHKNVLLVEFFEMRLPRDLKLLDLNTCDKMN